MLRSDWWYFANDSRLRFAALQSEAGRALLLRSGRAPDDISSLVLVEKDRFLLLWSYFYCGIAKLSLDQNQGSKLYKTLKCTSSCMNPKIAFKIVTTTCYEILDWKTCVCVCVFAGHTLSLRGFYGQLSISNPCFLQLRALPSFFPCKFPDIVNHAISLDWSDSIFSSILKIFLVAIVLSYVWNLAEFGANVQILMSSVQKWKTLCKMEFMILRAIESKFKVFYGMIFVQMTCKIHCKQESPLAITD